MHDKEHCAWEKLCSKPWTIYVCHVRQQGRCSSQHVIWGDAIWRGRSCRVSAEWLRHKGLGLQLLQMVMCSKPPACWGISLIQGLSSTAAWTMQQAFIEWWSAASPHKGLPARWVKHQGPSMSVPDCSICQLHSHAAAAVQTACLKPRCGVLWRLHRSHCDPA